jgi:hypothetical protein
LSFVTVLSLGVPISKTSPNAKIKSIESPVTKLLAKEIVLPDTLYELCGDCTIPFRLTIR